jgi:hypothetical protein
MKRIIVTVSAMLIISGIASAQDLKTYRATYDKEMGSISLSHGMRMTDLGVHYTKSLDSLLARVKKAGDLERTTAVMDELTRFRNERGIPKKPSVVLDIQNLQSLFAQQAYTHEANKAKAIISLTSKYDSALDRLQKSLVSSSKLDDARAVQKERESVKNNESYISAKAIIVSSNSTKPVAQPRTRFDWGKNKKGLSYSYVKQTYSDKHGYGDTKCQKLLDDIVKIKWGSHAVAWLHMSPSDIVFSFRMPVKPRSIRIHAFGKDAGGGISITRSIKVYTGTNRGNLIGQTTNLPNVTGWIEIPIEVPTASRSFLIELEEGDLEWVMIDEVEFN